MYLAETVRILVLTTLGFLIALIISPLWYRFLVKHRFGKQIRDSKETPVFSALHKKKEGTPTGAGVIIWLTVAILALVFDLANKFGDGYFKYLNFVSRSETYLPLAAMLAAALLGFLDDWFGVLRLGKNGQGIRVPYKIIVYTIIAAVGAWWFYFRLGWNVINIPLIGNFNIGPYYIIVFIFTIVASAFSANETDGLDGLLGGVSLFSFMAFTIIAFALHRYDLAAFCGVLMGALLAFLWFNIYPAKFFMGDTGSMSLGITLGVVAMLTNTLFLLPLLAFILVIESLSVIVQVISKKIFHRKIFYSTPIHHHFEALGWPESQITMRFWIISAITSSLAIVIFLISRL